LFLIIENDVGDPLSVKVVRVVSPAPHRAWEEVLRSDPYALESQSPAWAAAMCAAGGFEDVSRLYETAEGRRLVLPLLRRSMAGGLLAFDRANQPHCGVSGIIAAGGATAGEIGAVLDDLAGRRVLAQSVSPGPLLAQAWFAAAPVRATTVPHRAHTLDLAGGWDEIWSKRFSRTSRRGVRHAERAGVTVACHTSGQGVPEFCHLLEHAVVRLHVEEPDRPDVALPVGPSRRHHPPGGAAAEAVRAEELTEDRAHRLLLESHDLIQQLQVPLKSRDGR